MAIEDADGALPEGDEGETPTAAGGGATVGEYTWEDFLREHGHEEAAELLYGQVEGRALPGGTDDDADRDAGGASPSETWTPAPEDWDRVDVDPADYLGFAPEELAWRLRAAHLVGDRLYELGSERYDLTEVPVLKGYYTWDDYEREFFLDEEGNPPTDEEGEPLTFSHADKREALGFDPDYTENRLAGGADAAEQLQDLVAERTVDVADDLDEDAFFSTSEGYTTLANRYDLEKAVPMEKKRHFREEERYWVNKPYAFVVIFHSTKENEKKYYAVQPHMNSIEEDLTEFLTGKLRTSIKYADESVAGSSEEERKAVIERETDRLLDRYDLYEGETEGSSLANEVINRFGVEPNEGIAGRIAQALGYEPPVEEEASLRGVSARPEPAVVEEDPETLSEYQVEKLLYYLKRDFIGYERIDPIKYDINVEDISCDGYNSPVFVYHSDYEQIITNIYHGEEELDDFVVKLAQRSGKGISKRRPQVDATLPDGSRAQLTLGKEVSDHGTNYTIRQFKDVPFTPIDLINWKTFSLDEMAFLWLCIENHKSLIFAGGTASGKTTSLNAVSLFIPSNSKIVSIEDTREVELPQRNWIASVTRPSFSDDDKGDVDEFDLLEAALRQRPDYIVMGEIRGEEGRTAFQVMSTGHTTYTTFHADTVGEVLKRFTTDPINVSKTMFTALDLVSIQAATRVQGKKVRRNKSLTEINHYDAENDEINVQDVYQWQAETDEFLQMGDSNTLEEIKFDRGWDQAKLEEELFKRRVVLAYLIDRGLNSYAQVAATFQAFINDPETILALMANDGLERSLEDLREMESVLINVDPEKEEMVPRPDPDEEGREEAAEILREAESLFETYRGERPDSVAEALLDVPPAADVEATPDEHTALEEAAEEAAALDEGDAVGELDAGEAEGDEAGGPPALDPGVDEPAAEEAGAERADDGEIDFSEPFDDEGFDVTEGVDAEPGDDGGGPEVEPGPHEEPEPNDGPAARDDSPADGGTAAPNGGEELSGSDDEPGGETESDGESEDAGEDDTEGAIDEWGFGDVDPADEEE